MTQQIPKHASKAFEGEIFTVWQWEQELFDGSKAIFEAIDRTDSSMVIGVLPNEHILIAEDEQPHRPPLLTLPGGRIEAGEAPEDGAKREFMEETGYEIGELRHFFSQQAGSSTVWHTHIFVGRDLRKTEEPKLDPGERITLMEYSFDEFLELGKHKNFRNKELKLRLLEALCDISKRHTLYDLLYV